MPRVSQDPGATVTVHMSSRTSWPLSSASLSVLVLTFCGCAKGVDDGVVEPLVKTEKAAPTIVVGGGGSGSSGSASGGSGGNESRDASADVSTAVEAGVVAPPVVDGDIQPGEYGVHANGQNQLSSTPTDPASTTWYMTWTDTHLYIGVSAANVAEGVVLYVDHAPLTPSNTGTNADGSTVSPMYDNTRIATLPFRADFAAYFKSGYNEYRTANGNNGWSSPVTGALAAQGTGAKREIAIPWSVIRPAGRPSSFAWFGYATSAGGYVYGGVPTDNARGNIGLSASFGSFFTITDATPGVGTKPFALTTAP